MIISALQAGTAHSTVPADSDGTGGNHRHRRPQARRDPVSETGQQLEMRLWEKSQQCTVAGLLREARERAEDQFVHEERMQQLGRSEVSGEAGGADQVKEQGTREFQTEEICLQAEQWLRSRRRRADKRDAVPRQVHRHVCCQGHARRGEVAEA